MKKLAILILSLLIPVVMVAQSCYTGGSSDTVPEGITVEILPNTTYLTVPANLFFSVERIRDQRKSQILLF